MWSDGPDVSWWSCFAFQTVVTSIITDPVSNVFYTSTDAANNDSKLFIITTNFMNTNKLSLKGG
jgi:hypothetical protein